MPDLYVPPPGAMQFEITHVGSRYRYQPLDPHVAIWVLGPHERNDTLYLEAPSCDCVIFFGILKESCPPEWQEKLKTQTRPVVCACYGHLIE